jgi:hypothetical protein
MALDGFVHAEGGRLVDGHGERLMLRGVGLGNWLLPEGYMWNFEHPGPQSPREIEALVLDLVGDERAAEFWRRFRSVFITEEDIARIHAEGLNHVRLPINSRIVIDDDSRLIEAGFGLIDRLIEWCRRHNVWVVLDLHGAPGGQTGTKIDDSPGGAPELFIDERYRAVTVKLWRAIAQRYRDEPVVAAYDLLNEPLPNEYQHMYPDRLRDVYAELTAAIRDIDRNHLISYEGSHWATNWEIFTEVWDRNSVLQFHKYWSPPDRPSIQNYIDIGRELGLPIYMGEGGENNLEWIHTAFQLYEDCDISWNFWPWKKVETLTSPCSVDAPAGWSDITAYAAGRSAKPAAASAWQTLNGLLDALPLARCTYRSEVISALLRRAPLTIPATGFGFRGAGRSYMTRDAVPLRAFRSDDKVTIRPAGVDALDWGRAGSHSGPPNELLVSLREGDWVAYDVTIAGPTQIQLSVDFQPDGHADLISPLGIAVDGHELQVAVAPDKSTVRAASSQLSAGLHVVRLTGRADETELRSIDVRPWS